MFGSDGKRDGGESSSPPMLEALEPRLLLTTMALDPATLTTSNFVYENSQGDYVRVTLSNDVTGVGAVELMRWDLGTSNVAHISGELDGTPMFGGLASTFQLDTLFPLWATPEDVQAIGYDDNLPNIWAFDNYDSEMMEVDTGTGMPTGTNYGIVDSAEATFVYDVTAMDVDPATGIIYAVGTLVDTDPVNPPALPAPPGPFLLYLDPFGGIGTQVNVGQATGQAVNDLAYIGGVLYGTNGPNLLTLGMVTGIATVGPAFVDITNNNAAITNMTGLEEHQGAVYGQGGTTVYTIDLATGDCTPLPGNLSQGDMTDLTSDGTNLWGVYSSNDQTRMCIIEVNPPRPGDPFTVYVAAADEYTTLTFTTIGRGPNDVPLLNDIQLWSSANTPALLLAADAIVLSAPAGSGGVLIGGLHTYIPSMPDLHTAVTTTGVYAMDASPLGVYPGGLLHPGVMFQGPMGVVLDYGGDAGLGQSVSALAGDSAGAFYAVDNLTQTLMQATYDDTTTPPSATSVPVGQLVDVVEPTFVYGNVTGLDFDSTDTLYGIATVIDTIPGPPTAPTGTWLVAVDHTTGVVTRVVELSGATNITTIAFDDADVLYAVDGDTNSLVTIDMGTGAVSTIGPITHVDFVTMPEIEGLAFREVPDPADPASTITILSGVGGAVLFDIDVVLAEATPLGEVGFRDLPALAHSAVYPDLLWSVTMYDQAYRLVRVDPYDPPLDFGRLLVAGTVAGTAAFTGSIDVYQVGFLWGNVDVRRDMGSLLVQTDVARDGTLVMPDNALIHGEGTLHEMDVYGSMYGSMDFRGAPDIPFEWDRAVDLNALRLPELESKPVGPNPYIPWAEDGDLKTVSNDVPADAQFLFNESGNLTLWGTIEGPLAGDLEDFYAISLMAGQEIRLDGYLGWWSDMRAAQLYGGPMLWAMAVEVYDSNLNLLGSVGYETIEDAGVGSRPPWASGATQEPLDFTAPRAGTYFLRVEGVPSTYTVFVLNGTSATLGGVDVTGDFLPQFGGLNARGAYDVAASAGNFGALEVDGAADVRLHVFDGGDAVSYRAGTIGATSTGLVISHGNIGLVESTVGAADVVVVAGAEGGSYNNDAHIDNVIIADSLMCLSAYPDPVLGRWLFGLWSAGSIGSIFVGGDVDITTGFTINGDDVGPTSFLDLIDVRGDWGAPGLYHGVNADIRAIHVAGTIYTDFGTWIGPLEPTKFDNGTPSVIDDDGGGQIRIGPGVLVDANGDPVLVPDPTDPNGRRMMTVPTPYEFYVIPVTPLSGFGKTGSVLVNLTMGGPGTLSVEPGDVVDIGHLELTGPGDFRMTGNGSLSVYHVQATDVTSFVNTTRGDLASGNFDTSVARLDLAGNLGRRVGSLGQWVWGYLPAPAGSQMGWFFGQINGVLVNGDITDLDVDGWMGDLLVTGRAEDIRVNADGLTPPGGYEGVIGVVHVGSLNRIDVGDGLADDGSGTAAIAAILSDAEIERVLINGPGRVLNGSVLAMDYIAEVLGRNGAIDTAIIASSLLDSYQVWLSSFTSNSWIGRVDFTGEGAAIDGSEIYATYIGTISTSSNSDGISNSHFSGDFAPVNQEGIERILAGGPGMYNTAVGANGGKLGVIRGVGPMADMTLNFINPTDSLRELSARDLYNNYITVPNNVGLLKASRDIFGNLEVHVGSISKITTGRHFAGNYFTIGSELTSAKIGARFSDSTLEFQGPDSQLGTLDVVGDITGQILSAGEIGQIISRTGIISADIETVVNRNPGDIGLISTFGGYEGALDVAGALKKFVSYSTLGVDPSTAADYTPKRFNIAGDLGNLNVVAARNGPPVHLYTTLYVGGNAGSIDVDGSLYADLLINGSLDKLTLAGDMGGSFSVPAPTVLGNVTVLGELGRFSMPASSSIVGDMTIGGSIKKIALKDKAGLPGAGDIAGDITSLYGSIAGVSLTNGVLSGSLTAATGIGKISLKGTPADRASITGDIVAQGGGIASIDIRNGDLDADVSAMAGGIGKFKIRDGDAVAGHTIYTVGSIGSLAVQNGNLDADVVAEAGLGKLDIKGSDLTGDVTIGTDAKRIKVAGDVAGSTIWVGGLLKAFSAGSLTNSVVSSLLGMDKVAVGGNVTDSQIVGGYNAATTDLHSARVKSIKVGGNWNSSIVAVGVDPVDGDFTTLLDNLPAPGLSGLDKMTLDGAPGGAGNLIIADTWTGDTPAGIPTATVDVAPPALSPNPAHRFGEGTTTIGGVVITLKGPGVGSFDPAANVFVLNNTTDKTTLTADNPGAGREVTLAAGDDESFSGLTLSGDLTLGDTDVDGLVKKFTAGGAVAGATWQIAGGVGSMITLAIANADVVLGGLGSWNINGGFLAGSLTTSDITKGMAVAGDLGAAVTTLCGTIKKLDVAGTLGGDVTSYKGIDRLTAGSVTGDVVVQTGDLKRMQVNGDLAGNVDVQSGYLGKLDIRGGSFGSPLVDKAIRALTGIGRYSLSGGVSGGIISTEGAIKKIKVNSTMQTRVRADNGIGSVTVDVLTDAMLSSGTYVGKVTVRGDMTRSDIVAGFDPSDAGYDPAAGGDAANVRFDGRTLPLAWRTVGNMDRLNGGDVIKVKIGGDMIASSIAAGVGPGADGWYGTDDDQTRGTGYIRKVSLGGSAGGSADPTEQYGIYAASSMPVVSGTGLFFPLGNFDIGTLAAAGGSPRVIDVEVYRNRVQVFFDHDLDFSTINTARMDAAQPTTFELIVSRNGVFGPAEPDDVNVSDDVPNAVTYDPATNSVTLTLVGNTWYTLNQGTHFRLIIDGSTVADRRGNLLDGEFDFLFPSGNGLAGGDFVYYFVFGDAGEVEATATDLGNVIVLNQTYTINGEIGDNVGIPTLDVDVYRVPVSEGDIFYYYAPTTSVMLTGTAGLAGSRSGAGRRASVDGDVYVHVTGGLMSYSVYVMVFNDGNSNFNFDDSVQAATVLAWDGNVAEPDLEDQDVLAPDDVDLYSLGVLPANTEVTVSLETILIGSPLSPKMAVFNSTGDLVGNIMFGDDPGAPDIGTVVPAITLTGTIQTPADDTYYVAVAGLGRGSNYLSYDMGRYRLTVTKQAVAAPVYPKQVVYLNFTGGVADYLATQFGDTVETYQEPLSAEVFGFEAVETQTLLNSIFDTVETVYAGFTNIEFTAVKPLTGPYTTVFVGGSRGVIPGLLGIAQWIDPFNRHLTDDCVAFAGEFAIYYSAAGGYSVDDMGKGLGYLAAHELGHILGLNHVEITTDNWLMGYGDDMTTQVLTTHAPLMRTPSYEFLIGYQNSVGSLAPIA